jgi:hypothetical protein
MMDFLIDGPVRAVLLHKAGIAVTSPNPARFAIHKLALSQARRAAGDLTKHRKDLAQASELIQALDQSHRASDLAEAGGVSKTCNQNGPRSSIAARLRSSQRVLALLADAIVSLGGGPFEKDQDPAETLAARLNPPKPSPRRAPNRRESGGIGD